MNEPMFRLDGNGLAAPRRRFAIPARAAETAADAKARREAPQPEPVPGLPRFAKATA